MSATAQPALSSPKLILIIDDTPINLGVISGALAIRKTAAVTAMAKTHREHYLYVGSLCSRIRRRRSAVSSRLIQLLLFIAAPQSGSNKIEFFKQLKQKSFGVH